MGCDYIPPVSKFVVTGFVYPNQRWHDMKDVWNSCQKAGVTVPREVSDYFGLREPTTDGAPIFILKKDFESNSSEGCTLQISDIPDDVYMLKFCRYKS